LGTMQTQRRSRKASFLRHGNKGFQLVQVHVLGIQG
jgi:hypothetical protein